MLQHCTPRLNSLALEGASLTQAAARFPSKSAQGSHTAAARQLEFEGIARARVRHGWVQQPLIQLKRQPHVGRESLPTLPLERKQTRPSCPQEKSMAVHVP